MKLMIDIPDEAYKFIIEHGIQDTAEIDKILEEGTPVPTGEWIIGQTMDCHSDIINIYTCPFCGAKEYRAYSFCHCGADMRKDEDNDQ